MSHHNRETPLERELAGLPELNAFGSDADRRAALRAVHERLEDPYTVGYWLWVAALLTAALAVGRLIGWGLKAAGAPWIFPAVLALVGGIATYSLLYRALIRWAARPELKRELDARTASAASLDTGRQSE